MHSKIKQNVTNFLIWSQKWTQTDMIYLAKGGFWVTIEQIIFNLIGIVSIFVFANYLDQEIYGNYQYIISMVAILQFFALSGINGSLSLTVARGNSGTFIPSLKEKIKWGLLGSFVSLVGGIYYLSNQNEILGYSFIFISLVVPFIDSLHLFNPYLLGLKKFKDYSTNNIKIKIFATTIIVVSVLLTNNIYILIFVTIVPSLVVRLYFTKKYLKKYPPNNKIDKDAINLGKHLSFMGFLSGVITHLDKIIIFQFLGAKEVAVYTIAMAPISKISSLLSGNISMLSLPKISGKSIVELKKILPKKIRTLTIFLSLITITYIVLAPTLFELFLPKYIDSVFLSQVFAFSIMFLPSSLFNISLTSHSKKKQLYLLNFVIPTIKILLFIVLLPLLGSLGMILAILFGEMFKYILSSYLFYKIKE